MAFGKKKPEKVADDARTARQDGNTIFTPKLGVDPTSWSQMVQAIEAEGWQLEHWAVAQTPTVNLPEAYPLFRAR